ncbi:Fic family protein [Adlercreutzia sp. ZJ154]|uniref:Fic family protein n=1 Tax=Adlercreutzia sp. ZJ154 TaxID=2709790 RepID=UPI0013EC5DA3|nr:Fic family protein [Adlercreutzia sp. ZJ154]
MNYAELRKVYYRAEQSDPNEALEKEFTERFNSSSTFKLDFSTTHGSLFIAVPSEMTTLFERVLRRERKISKLMQQLPGIAGDEVLRSLVFDEVISSNSVENIHSTRRQIEEALRSSNESGKVRRFREFARLYLDMTFSVPNLPTKPDDIRDIYDKVMDGEVMKEKPDGRLFRKDRVYVSNGLEEVHSGLYPEDEIVNAMEKMLRIAYTEEMPSIYGAIAAHYIFEYAHPFYDGNGRTGRYLLSLWLEKSLSKPTALSLSRVIAKNKDAYYKAFKITEDRLNKAELTFFVFTMLEFIFDAQSELIDRLERGTVRYEQLENAMSGIQKSFGYKTKEMTLIFALAQQNEFGMFKDIPLQNLSDLIGVSLQQTRKYLSKLIQDQVVKKVRGRNPVTFALTDNFFEQYLDGTERDA